VAPDGTFVTVEADPNARPTLVHVVLNWIQEVEQRTRAK
jgi:hypothetical protein